MKAHFNSGVHSGEASGDCVERSRPGAGGCLCQCQENGQPVVQPDDKEVRFDFTPAVFSRRLFLTFKVAKMFYQDQLSF